MTQLTDFALDNDSSKKCKDLTARVSNKLGILGGGRKKNLDFSSFFELGN